MFNLGSASFVPLLHVGSETIHFPNESPAELKQCLVAFENSLVNCWSLMLRSELRTALGRSDISVYWTQQRVPMQWHDFAYFMRVVAPRRVQPQRA
jgi:hypothetical protein